MGGILELLKILLPILLPLIGNCYAGMNRAGRKVMSRYLRNSKNCLRQVQWAIETFVVKEGQALNPQVQDLLTMIEKELEE